MAPTCPRGDLAGVVGIGYSKQAEGAGHAKGGVERRGRLPVAPGPLEAGGAGTAELSKPGDEGAGGAIEAVALDGARGALLQQS
jgi:hypothetical protein